jgi:hypothetical protein
MCPVQNNRAYVFDSSNLFIHHFPKTTCLLCKNVQLRKQMNFTVVGSDRHYMQVQEEMISLRLSNCSKTQYSKLGWSKTISTGTIEIN